MNHREIFEALLNGETIRSYYKGARYLEKLDDEGNLIYRREYGHSEEREDWHISKKFPYAQNSNEYPLTYKEAMVELDAGKMVANNIFPYIVYKKEDNGEIIDPNKGKGWRVSIGYPASLGNWKVVE